MSAPVLMLTAAVNPSPVVPFTALDRDQRLSLYLEAFSNWRRIAASAGLQLLVVETTGASREELRLAKSDLLLAHSPDTSLEPRGKGALESSALDAGMDFVRDEVGPAVTVHKVTGKLAIPNWRALFERQQSNTLRIRRSMDRRVCDSRVFSTTPDTWLTHFAGLSSLTDDPNGVYLEHVLGFQSVLAEFNSLEFRLERFRRPPRIHGVSGSDGSRYGGFSKDGLSFALSQVETHLLPPFQKRMI